jgi:hypothetical protein
MLIEPFWRDRATALQSGPSDVGLFGATPETFNSWTHSDDFAVSVGAAGAQHGGGEVVESGGGAARTQTLSFDHDTSLSTRTLAAGDSAASIGALDVHIGTGVALSYAVASLPAGSGTQLSTLTGATLHARSDVSVETRASEPAKAATAEAAETTSTVTSTVEQVQQTAASQTEALGAAVATEIAALKAQAEQAIATLTSQTAAQIEALEKTAETLLSSTLQAAAALPGDIAGIGNSLVAPVLATIAELPDTIEAGLDTSIAAGVEAEIALGDQTIGVDLAATVSAATALDSALSISGSDVAGGIGTLVGMLAGDGGFVVEDGDSGFAWSEGQGPLDTLDTLADDAVDLPDALSVDPGAILLGIAETGSDLLGGLPSFDDHGHG